MNEVNFNLIDWIELVKSYRLGRMSEVFEGYERQYRELSANVTKKCTSAALLDGSKRQKGIFHPFKPTLLCIKHETMSL